ncbi:hypothetical protein AB0C02_30350 [Micromonospora sp. NPDC048999]|uniref:hypothetical protein n=1 Tax=Micromonospora sp. NPDC048999 TaxID=3155391 RepID=UPI00340D8082
MELRAGTVVQLCREASVQFGGDREIWMTLVSVDPKPTYAGWIWLTGYVLSRDGKATGKREVFVRRAGVRVIGAAPAWAATAGARRS